MSWESPIEIIVNQMESAWMDETFRVIQKVGIDVDRNELIKALQYDRNQYEKGYEDGRNDIIRCKDCEYYTEEERWCRRLGLCGAFDQNDYCSHAERRTDETD